MIRGWRRIGFTGGRGGPEVAGYATAVNSDRARRVFRVAPDGVDALGQAGVDGRVAGAAAGTALPDQRVRPGRSRPAAGRADLDLPAVQLGGRVQDQGTDTGAQVKNDTARAGRAGDMFRHCFALFLAGGRDQDGTSNPL